MADVHTPRQRSYNMQQIRSKDTKPEMLVRKFLHANGFRYKLHDKNLPGKPDIVLPKYHTVIFVHGCFWHGHKNCKYFKIPKTRTRWWTDKINRNKANDEKAVKALKKEGWKVVPVWECGLKPGKIEATITGLLKTIRKSGITKSSRKKPIVLKKNKLRRITSIVADHGRHPFFIKKANTAKALLKEVGLPRRLVRNK